MQIKVDDRERVIIPYMYQVTDEFSDITFHTMHMNIGDYAICYMDKILMIVERKTLEDLASSFYDGRKANIEKLLALRQQCGCKIVYLIEGAFNPMRTKKIGKVPFGQLQSHLDHLIMRDDVHIIYTLNHLQSAYRLHELAKNYMTLDVYKEFIKTEKAHNSEETSDIKVGNKDIADDLLKQKILTSDDHIHRMLLCSIPKVGMTSAEVLLNNRITLRTLIMGEITKADIDKLVYPNGSSFSARMRNILYKVRTDHHKYSKKIYEAIPGIGPVKRKILQTRTLTDIISGNAADLDKLIKNKAYSICIKYLTYKVGDENKPNVESNSDPVKPRKITKNKPTKLKQVKERITNGAETSERRDDKKVPKGEQHRRASSGGRRQTIINSTETGQESSSED